jgi:hypothetical protein
MTTRLQRTIRREILIDGEPYTVAISPDGLRLSRKRFRTGKAISWRALVERLNGGTRNATGDGSESS